MLLLMLWYLHSWRQSLTVIDWMININAFTLICAAEGVEVFWDLYYIIRVYNVHIRAIHIFWCLKMILALSAC